MHHTAGIRYELILRKDSVCVSLNLPKTNIKDSIITNGMAITTKSIR